jgi:hypothetical protein
MDKKIRVNISLIFAGILLVVFLLITIGPVLSGESDCRILPSVKEDEVYYCPTCSQGAIVVGRCNILPTPGSSGCGCANDYCMGWIDNDVCDWTKGIKICKAVCGDLSGTACAEVAAKGGLSVAAGGGGVKWISFNKFQISYLDYVPVGGCCENDMDCSSGRCVVTESSRIKCKIGKECVNVTETEGCRVNPDCKSGCCYDDNCSYVGDVDCSGKVDIKDVYSLAKAFGSEGSVTWDKKFDFNGDNGVDVKDLQVCAHLYGCNKTENGWIREEEACDSEKCEKCDFSGNEEIDETDIYLFQIHLGTKADPEYEVRLDLDRSGRIDIKDIFIVAKNYGKSVWGI